MNTSYKVTMKVMHLMAVGAIGGIEVLMSEYAKYSTLDNVYVYTWEGGPMAEAVCMLGKKVYFTEGNPVGDLKMLLRIYKIFKEERPDALVVHHGAPLLRVFAGGLSFVYQNLNVYIYMHSDAAGQRGNFRSPKGILTKWFNWIGLHRATKVIAISEFVKEGTIKYFHVQPEKIEVIYNGTDLSRFQIVEGKYEKGKRGIYIGRLEKGKGVQIILHALSLLKSEFHLDVVGDGTYRESLVKFAEELGIKDKVTFHGSQKNVQSYLAQAGIFIHTPVLEEGFGNTIVEAMAEGLVCICSRSGGIPEIIKDGENGYLIEKDNPRALASRLEYVISHYDDAMLETIRATARQSSEVYSIQEYASAFEQTVSRGGGKSYKHLSISSSKGRSNHHKGTPISTG